MAIYTKLDRQQAAIDWLARGAALVPVRLSSACKALLTIGLFTQSADWTLSGQRRPSESVAGVSTIKTKKE